MESTLFGIKLHLEYLIIIAFVVWIMSAHMLCSCTRVSLKEGMEVLKHVVNNKPLHNSWTVNADNYKDATSNGLNSGSPEYMKTDYKGTSVPLDDETLFFFGQNEFKPECCPSAYSIGSGCACLSHDQMKHLNQRGGNRTSGNI